MNRKIKLNYSELKLTKPKNIYEYTYNTNSIFSVISLALIINPIYMLLKEPRKLLKMSNRPSLIQRYSIDNPLEVK